MQVALNTCLIMQYILNNLESERAILGSFMRDLGKELRIKNAAK